MTDQGIILKNALKKAMKIVIFISTLKEHEFVAESLMFKKSEDVLHYVTDVFAPF